MFPKRGAFALLITIVALVALLGYKTPEMSPLADGGAYVDAPGENPAFVAEADATEPGAIRADSDPATPAEPDTSSGTDPSATSPSPATPGSPTATGGSSATPPRSGPTVAAPSQTKKPTQPAPSVAPKPTPAPTPAPTRTPTPVATPAPGFTGSVDGSIANTPYGPIQVRVTFSNGKIANVTTLKTPTRDEKSIEIAQYACPILRSEALKAQSAKIDSVSGATYTSTGYKSSLQSALNKV
jgi:uncharacterized protein with FMN-binding domain